MALMGTGIGRGESRAREAAQAAISSPLLEDLSIDGARGRADQHHRRRGHDAPRGERGLDADPGGGARGRQHHLRRRDRRDAEGGRAARDRDRDGPRRRPRRPRHAALGRRRRAYAQRAPRCERRRRRRARRRRRRRAGRRASRPRRRAAARGARRRTSDAGDDFVSPFEDELRRAGVPAPRARRRDEDDREVPAFLRRSAD